MMWQWGAAPYGWVAWFVGSLFMLALWGGVIVLVVWGIRSLWPAPAAHDDAVEVLRRRFASGEISQDEYERARELVRR